MRRVLNIQLSFSVLAILLIILSKVSIAETVQLNDGRTVKLEQDGTYQFVSSNRGFNIALIDATKPGQMDFMANPDRDCVLVFEVDNKVGGNLLNFSGNIEVKNNSNANVEAMGFSNINPFGLLSDKPIANGDAQRSRLIFQENCKNILSVTLLSVEDKYCNFVGRKEDDSCFRLSNVESKVGSISFSK